MVSLWKSDLACPNASSSGGIHEETMQKRQLMRPYLHLMVAGRLLHLGEVTTAPR